MSLNSQKFSLWSAVSAGMVYAVCTLFVALWPSFSTKLMGWLFHLSNPEAVFGSMRVNFTGFVGGFLEVLIYTYVAARLFTLIFNRSTK